MSAQSERTAFEAWVTQHIGEAIKPDIAKTWLVRMMDNTYASAKVTLAWESWQASASRPAAAVAVPAGWKLVPIEPAEAMLRDGAAAIWGPMLLGPHYRGLAGKAYAAMLSAAPASAAVEGEPMSIDDPRMYSAVHAPYVGPVVLVDVAKLMDPQATKGCA